MKNKKIANAEGIEFRVGKQAENLEPKVNDFEEK